MKKINGNLFIQDYVNQYMDSNKAQKIASQKTLDIQQAQNQMAAEESLSSSPTNYKR